MAIRRAFFFQSGIVALASLALVAGCTSGTTYGTGVNQETQLLQDLGGMVALGTSQKKESINYSSRAKLVKPPTVEALPTPAETVGDQAGYFPTNPEERRVLEINEAEVADERSGNISVEELRRRKLNSDRIATQSKASADHTFDREESADKRRKDSFLVRQKVADRRAALRGAQGAAPRRYLTEPPKEYRTPADTAEIGLVGEAESDPNVKKKTGIFDGLLKTSKDGS